MPPPFMNWCTGSNSQAFCLNLPWLVYFNLLCMHMSITNLSSRPKEGNSLCVFAWLSPFPRLCPLCPPFEGAWQLKQHWCPRHHRPLHHHLSGDACEHYIWPEPQLTTISKIITGVIINVALLPSAWTTFIRQFSVSAPCCLSPSLARKKEYQFTMFQLVKSSPIQYFACINVQQF